MLYNFVTKKREMLTWHYYSCFARALSKVFLFQNQTELRFCFVSTYEYRTLSLLHTYIYAHLQRFILKNILVSPQGFCNPPDLLFKTMGAAIIKLKNIFKDLLILYAYYNLCIFYSVLKRVAEIRYGQRKATIINSWMV